MERPDHCSALPLRLGFAAELVSGTNIVSCLQKREEGVWLKIDFKLFGG